MKYRERMIAGTFISKSGNTSSLSALHVNGALSAAARVRGIASIASGTAVATVSAAGVASGDVIIANVYMPTTLPGSAPLGIDVCSVQAGLFHVRTAQNINTVGTIPVSWFVLK